MPPQPDGASSGRFRAAAAALAALPLGFAAGALLGAHLIVGDRAANDAGAIILACGVGGAGAAAALMAGVAKRTAARPARVATIVVAALSFAVLVYLVRDFVADRMAQARAFDAAYAQAPEFELELRSGNSHRRPFSRLAYDSTTRDFVAERPGGWTCRATGNRRHKLALFEGINAAERVADAECRDESASWRVHGGGAAQDRCAGIEALLAAADDMVLATARGASCRRTERRADR